MSDYSKYVGMDVHKSTIAVAIAESGRKQPVSYGIIENAPKRILDGSIHISHSKAFWY